MSQELISPVSAPLENGTKICTKCHQVKEFEEFPIDRRRKDHRNIVCKECQKKEKEETQKKKLNPVKGFYPELSKYTAGQLIKELQYRGYYGELQVMQKIKVTPIVK
jgi:hypothetical protein|nr:MAG TPA_asm: Meiotic chromosome segregation protein [Caudoviricetes sp.]